MVEVLILTAVAFGLLAIGELDKKAAKASVKETDILGHGILVS